MGRKRFFCELSVVVTAHQANVEFFKCHLTRLCPAMLHRRRPLHHHRLHSRHHHRHHLAKVIMEGHHVNLMSFLESSLVEVSFVHHHVIRTAVAPQIFHRILSLMRSAIYTIRMAIVIVGWHVLSIWHARLDLNVTKPPVRSSVFVLTQSRWFRPQRCLSRTWRLRLSYNATQTGAATLGHN